MDAVKAEREKDTQTPDDEDKVWRAHLETFLNFMGSEVEYCRRNSLSLSKLRFYKEKFGMSRQYKRRPTPFVRVKTAEPQQIAKPAEIDRMGYPLPDPKWMAEFVTALLGKR
jgi:hypothetical protein